MSMKLPTMVLVYIFEKDGSFSYHHAPDYPNGFKNDAQAWAYINQSNLPIGANPVEVYLPSKSVA